MPDSVVISHQLNEAIKNFQWKGSGVKGFLIGGDDDSSTILSVWQNDITDITNIGEDMNDCLSHFPAGKSIVGIVLIGSQSLSNGLQSGNLSCDVMDQELSQTFGSSQSVLESLDCVSVIVLCLHKSTTDTSSQQWETSFVSVTKSSVKQLDAHNGVNLGSSTRMRLKADIPLLLSSPSKQGVDWSCQIKEECTKFLNWAEAGSFAFGFDGNRALVYKGGMSVGSDFRNWKQVKDIKKYLKEAAEQREEEVVRPTSKTVQKPIDVSLLHMGSDSSRGPCHGPIIGHKKGTLSSASLKLPVDILVDVKEDLAIQKLYRMLSGALARQISAFEKCLLSFCKSDRVFTPEVFHFKPSVIDTAVSFVYPGEMAEGELKNERMANHDRLLVPKDKPYFRKASAGLFLNPTAPGGYLINPHVGLNVPNSVRSGTVAVVEGNYSYHHYMQDRFNDDKWGCAYRSLQSIVSWFKYQGYTDKSIPSHRDIQQALYKCGDKSEKFVGSRQWIGSFEVSYVLDHLLGVSSKFINVNSGAELATTGQQLLHHFQSQGTPVMIGGGVLAHTILGVAYDEATGDIAFLILDPHYTGGEDLKIVQDKGWCGWKDMKFWDQTAHYNMCLPQRPDMV